MKATTLYEHLLHEATGWLIYPTMPERRTQVKAKAMALVDQGIEWMVEEYTTFSTSTRGPSDLSPELLDAKFCRELLRSVPKMIERTRSLSNLSPEVIPNGACLVYLKEAVRCYILGLSQASIALARAAVETALLQRDPNIPGENFSEKINEYARETDLPPEWRKRAHNVRRAANEVLHQRPKSLSDVLAVIEDARKVILELSSQSR
jgi:hypothetical protein